MQHSAVDDTHRQEQRPSWAARRPPRIRVLVADRHEATRIGLRLALEEAGFEVCGECADARAAVARAATDVPDVCVVDAELPGGAADAVAGITALGGAPGVVVLAVGEEGAGFFAALRSGALGYLRKNDTAEALAASVHAAAAGEAFLGQPFLTRLVGEFRSGRRLASGELSAREREVLVLLGEGLTTKGVAARLGLSSTTVRRHVSSALHKLGCGDRASALSLIGVQQLDERR